MQEAIETGPRARGVAADTIASNLLAYILLLIGGALFMLPFLFLVSTALKSVDETNEFPPSLLPHRPVMETYSGRQYPVGALPDGREVLTLGPAPGDSSSVMVVDRAAVRKLPQGVGGPSPAIAAMPEKVKSADVKPVKRLGVHLENFRDALLKPEIPFTLFFRNTLIIVLMTVIGATLSAALCAYGFARLRFRGREPLFILLLATMMIPGQVTMIPVYILFKQLHWINTYLPLIVPAWFGGGAFSIFLLRQFFQGIPYEMEEAARIDGSGPLATWWRIILPLSIPALATVAIFTFMGSWNDFMGPLIYINDTEKYTLALGINLFKGQYGTDTPHLMMAATLVVLMPVLILFFVAQKQFIQGIVVSGVKG